MAVAVGMTFAYSAIRLFMASLLTGMRVSDWLRKLALPVAPVAVVALAAGAVPRFLAEPGFLRLAATTLASVSAFLPVAWLFALDDAEKRTIKLKLHLQAA